jgi:methyl-coenzyme M reductase gamma subunit
MGMTYPGTDRIAERRRYVLNPETKFRKLREIPDEDIVTLLGHRTPGEKYRSIHPSLDELELPEDPIKELIEPSAGAKEGDRFVYLQITDSAYFSPLVPWFRGRLYHSRYKGIDTLVYSGRELLEARERELEKYAKELIETELFDSARTALRGITVHGSSLRLDENGLMFDGRRRYIYDADRGEVLYVKNQRAMPLDKPITVGTPLPERELIKNAIMYRPETVNYRKADELWEVTRSIMEQHVLGAFNPGRRVEE